MWAAWGLLQPIRDVPSLLWEVVCAPAYSRRLGALRSCSSQAVLAWVRGGGRDCILKGFGSHCGVCAVDAAAAAPSARQRRGQTTGGLAGQGRPVSVVPLWGCLAGPGLAGGLGLRDLGPSGWPHGACSWSLSACCWHSGFCWGAAHPFGPGGAQPIAGRKPMADSSSFRPDGSQCTWARTSCQPASWGGDGGDRPLPLLRLTSLGHGVKEDCGRLGEEWLSSEAAAQSCLAREGG